MLRALRLPSGAALLLVRGSVLAWRGDALVNAANEGCIGGSGVDGAVNDAGGAALVAERRTLGGCPTGQARSTRAHGLRTVAHIIHAVPPDLWKYEFELRAGAALLKRAYAAALAEARRLRARTVAFSLLSAGVYRGRLSLHSVLSYGAQCIIQAVERLDGGVSGGGGGGGGAAGGGAAGGVKSFDEIAMCAFTSAEADVLCAIFDGLAVDQRAAAAMAAAAAAAAVTAAAPAAAAAGAAAAAEPEAVAALAAEAAAVAVAASAAEAAAAPAAGPALLAAPPSGAPEVAFAVDASAEPRPATP